MNSKDFIIKSINEIVSSFPYLNFKYEYDSFSKSHFIEVCPNSSYKNDSNYIQIEKEITLRFLDLFPYESLTFLSEESYYKIENSIYENGFKNINLQLSFDSDSDIVSSNHSLFKDFSAHLPSHLELKIEELNFSSINFNTQLTSDNTLSNIMSHDFSINNHIHSDEKTKIVGELNFALAA